MRIIISGFIKMFERILVGQHMNEGLKHYDVVIVGAGPSSIFTAYELIKISPEKKILIIEKGKSVHKRNCPIPVLNRCVKCKPYCDITTGFAGVGAFSDAKLSYMIAKLKRS